MRKLSVLALVPIITLGVTFQVSADASPPLYPPGSALLPAGETMVQMVAEVVDITIEVPGEGSPQSAMEYRAAYQARFTMRNQGAATEQMDVRFPLTDADAWATIWDFEAFVDGQRVRIRKSEEPLTLDSQNVARWAVFPVTFEPGIDVEITVAYTTDISGWGWWTQPPSTSTGDSVFDAFAATANPDTATVYYILQTGAGWYGVIESGLIVLRLPYPAGPANVFGLDAGLAEWSGWTMGRGDHLIGPTFVENDARWEFTELEPTDEDNLQIQFLWPDEWQRILDLQAKADRDPADPGIALDLAGAYLAAGANIRSGYASEYHCSLSQQAIQRALVYDPSSSELLSGLEFIAGYCPELSAPLGQPTPTWSLVEPSVSPLPPTLTSSSASTAVPTVDMTQTDEAKLPTATMAAPSRGGSPSAGVQALVGIGLGVVIALILVGVRRRRTTR